MKLSHKGLVLVLVPVAFEFVFVGVLFYMLQQSELEVARAENARAVVSHLNRIQRNLLLFVAGMTPYAHLEYLRGPARTQTSINAINEELKALKACLKDQPEQLDSINQMQQSWEEAARITAQIKGTVGFSGAFDAASNIMKGRKLMSVLMKQADKVREQTEAVEAESPLRQAENRDNMKHLLILGLSVNVILAVALALSFNRVLAKRLAIVIDNTRRLASAQPLNAPLSGNDEIAELDKFFAKMASAMNVSQQKERALLKNAVDVICSIDGQGTISEVSPACEKVWGYSEDELLSRRLLSIVAEEDIEHQIETLKNDEKTHNFENRIKRNDGSLVDMLWSISWVAAEKSYFCVAHDNTDRKNAERMKRDFVSMLSHDLRSPLNSIQAFFWMVREKVYGELSEKGMAKAKGLESTTTWLIDMISDLLDIDRFEAGLFELELKDVSLKLLVEQANDALGSLADNDNIKVVLPTNDIIVRIDGDLFMRVITNLLSNAIKFSPPDSQVEVLIDNSDNLVELKIIDHGTGISEEDQKTVFDRFKQVKGTGVKKKRGSGLGLAVSKAIVEQHQGTIGVTSVLGEGSTFWVRLPAS